VILVSYNLTENRLNALKKLWERKKGKSLSLETRLKISKSVKKRYEEHPEYRQIISEKIKRLWQEDKSYISKQLSFKRSQYFKNIVKMLNKRNWADPKLRDLMVTKAIMASHVRPNKSEIKLIELLNRIVPHEYRYVGDGQVVLGGRNPDFINCNGKKKLIELWGYFWHKDDNPQDRINHFKKYGFDTLIIWEDELLDKALIEGKIKEFNR